MVDIPGELVTYIMQAAYINYQRYDESFFSFCLFLLLFNYLFFFHSVSVFSARKTLGDNLSCLQSSDLPEKCIIKEL